MASAVDVRSAEAAANRLSRVPGWPGVVANLCEGYSRPTRALRQTLLDDGSDLHDLLEVMAGRDIPEAAALSAAVARLEEIDGVAEHDEELLAAKAKAAEMAERLAATRREIEANGEKLTNMEAKLRDTLAAGGPVEKLEASISVSEAKARRLTTRETSLVALLAEAEGHVTSVVREIREGELSAWQDECSQQLIDLEKEFAAEEQRHRDEIARLTAERTAPFVARELIRRLTNE